MSKKTNSNPASEEKAQAAAEKAAKAAEKAVAAEGEEETKPARKTAAKKTCLLYTSPSPRDTR